MSDKPKRERKASTPEQLAKRRVKLEYQIRQALNKIYKLHLTKDNLVALVELIQSDPEKSYTFLSEPNYEKVKKAYEAKKSCIISMSKDEIDVLEEIVKKGRFDGKGFKDVMRSGLKGANNIARKAGYGGITDAVMQNTVGRIPGSGKYEHITDAVSGYADKRIRGMGANPYMPRGLKGGSLGPVPDFNNSAEYNDPVYTGTGDNDEYFASRQSGRGMRNSYY